MSIDVAVINFRKAIRDKRNKDIVQYKYSQYLREYEKIEEKDVIDKQQYRDLSNDFLRYMNGSSDSLNNK